MTENITVPANIRTEFDTSEINVGMNNVEEKLKDQQILADEPYIPTPDERCCNVVKVIKETSKFYQEEGSKLGGFSNVWELIEGVTPFIEEQGVYVVFTSIEDPTLFIDAILIGSDGEEFKITELPKIDEGRYVIDEAMIIIPNNNEYGYPSGVYVSKDIVKIIATSNIFPIQ